MPAHYVALGDSYAAGVGGGFAIDICWRSEDGYPVTLARRLGWPVAYQACLGATIGDVEAHQLGPLGDDTKLVTISVGGNDIGFVPVLIAAAEPSWMCDSDPAIDAALTRARTELPAALDRLLATVRQAAPSAQIVLTGYPRLFHGVDCNAATFFTTHEMRRLNDAADELETLMRAAADRAGIVFLAVIEAFLGHAVCDRPEWINGVSFRVEGSFHPNRLGHQAYADLLADAIDIEIDPTSLDTSVEIRRGVSEPGSAPTFAVPDLTSTRSREGAAAGGLDPDEVARLGERVRATGDPVASARLHEMDAQVRRMRSR